MKIESIEISNWRSITHLTASFNELSVIIGQNNHGKSNILSAILFFFGKIKSDNKDFKDPNISAYIEIKFKELDDNDKITFKKYLANDETIKIRKTLNIDLKFSYNGYMLIPQENWLNPANISNYTNREAILNVPLNDFVPNTGRLTKAIVEEAQLNYISENRDVLTFHYNIETSNFLGLKTVAQGIFGDVFFIPAVKNAHDELNPKGTSVFSELYTKILNNLSETNEAYIEAKKKVRQLVGVLNKSNSEGEDNISRPAELSSFEESISRELGTWNTSIEVEITPPNIDDIFKVGTQIWINDGVKTDIDRKGNGLQRALIFALIKSYSTIIRQENNQPQEETVNRQSSDSSYFIIEEPELYLHPQAQRDLYSTLKILSQNNNQVILTTHSNSFIDLKYPKSIIIAQKNDVEIGTQVKQCTDDIFEDIDDFKKLNLIYWINPERTELFFAKKVILLEGQTEKTIIPYLSKQLGIFKNEYTLIDCGSKSNMPLYIKLLNGFGLKYVVVYDKDHQEGKNAQAIESADGATSKIEEEINNQYGSSIVFDNDIEEEIGGINGTGKNKPFKALETVSNENYIIPEALDLKLKIIYE